MRKHLAIYVDDDVEGTHPVRDFLEKLVYEYGHIPRVGDIIEAGHWSGSATVVVTGVRFSEEGFISFKLENIK